MIPKLLSDDSPNVYITRRILNLLEKNLSMPSRYERVERKGILLLLEKLHIIKPLYKLKPELPIDKVLRVVRVQRLKLPEGNNNDPKTI